MRGLLEEIRSISKDAARELERADFRTDSEIKSLTQNDLHELLPGAEKLKVRKKVYEKIRSCTRKPIDFVLKELKSFIPDESFRDALMSNGPLVEYLHILKELKGQMDGIQEFLDAHISLLEKFSENRDQEPNQLNVNHAADAASLPSTSTSGTSAQSVPRTVHPQGTEGTGTLRTAGQIQNTSPTTGPSQTYTRVTVMYKMIIAGKTLNAHLDLLDKVKGLVQGADSVQLHLEEMHNAEDYRVIIVFCPVVSRVGTDAEAALNNVSDDKPIILVLMHHVPEPKITPSLRKWSRPASIVLDVNVFFHDTVHGLVKCKHNDDAVAMIKKKLLEYSSERREINCQSPSVTGFNFNFPFFSKPNKSI